MDRHPLTPATIALLGEPIDQADRIASNGIRQALDQAFNGSLEADRLRLATSVQVGPDLWDDFSSDLPSIAVEVLVLELGASPFHASGTQVRQVLYELMPAAEWFRGYVREDLMSFEAFWAWMLRVFGGPVLAEGHRACVDALADFDAGRLRRRQPEAA